MQAEEMRLSTRYQQFAPEFIHTAGSHPAAVIRHAIEGASPPLVICHRRSHQFFDRIFGGSVTESLAGAATFPLLSVPIEGDVT
jgi:nucleotide-binding universal stress UspA family protein